MDKNKLAGVMLGVALVVGGGAFYGGLAYARRTGNAARGNFQNLTPEQRAQARSGGMGARVGRNGMAGAGGGGQFIGGEIIDKDAVSFTIKLPDNSTKIIYFSASTTISKTTQGATNDLEVGKFVTVMGQESSARVTTAETIQVRSVAPTARN